MAKGNLMVIGDRDGWHVERRDFSGRLVSFTVVSTWDTYSQALLDKTRRERSTPTKG